MLNFLLATSASTFIGDIAWAASWRLLQDWRMQSGRTWNFLFILLYDFQVFILILSLVLCLNRVIVIFILAQDVDIFCIFLKFVPFSHFHFGRLMIFHTFSCWFRYSLLALRPYLPFFAWKIKLFLECGPCRVDIRWDPLSANYSLNRRFLFIEVYIWVALVVSIGKVLTKTRIGILQDLIFAWLQISYEIFSSWHGGDGSLHDWG